MENDEQIHELIDMARKLEGMPRHASTHAAGVVITDQPVSNMCHCKKRRSDRHPVYHDYPRGIRPVKDGFLGLRTLDRSARREGNGKKTYPDFAIE